VQEVVALPADLPLQTSEALLSLLSVPTALLSPAEHATGVSQTMDLLLQKPPVRNEPAVGVGDEVLDTTIDPNDSRPALNVGDLHLTDDRHKPLVNVSGDGALLRGAFDLAVENGLQSAELGEDDGVAVDVPDSRVRFAQGDVAATLLLEAGLVGDLAVAPLPGQVEFNQKLGADVARHVGQPGEFRPQPGQLVDLIEGREVAALAPWLVGAEMDLLETEVPKPAKGVFPPQETILLLRRRVNPEAEGLVGDRHQKSVAQLLTLVYRAVVALEQDFRRGRHVTYCLHAHLVFVPKYRKKTISKRVFSALAESWQTVCRDFGCVLQEANYESDHVHLLVEYPPKVSLSTLVNSLKGVSSRRLRALRLPEVVAKLWGKHFWSPSYCAVSCGGAPLAIIKRYIEGQRRAGSSPP
jgi:putative transposase